MNKNSRSINTLYNATTGFFGEFVIIVLGFAVRTVFIRCFSPEYLGISSLFQNVLAVLSVADLGIPAAIAFALYKPIADGDKEKVIVLMQLYKRAYRIIGFVFVGIGLALVPLLPILVNGEKASLINVPVVYLMYIARTASGYWFFAYRRTILIADQKKYVTLGINYIVNVVFLILQIVVLVAGRNLPESYNPYRFYAYTLLTVLTTIVANLFIARVSSKEYPYINQKTDKRLSSDEVKEIKKNIFGTSLYRISDVGVSCTDNILISVMINTDYVGRYSNYLLASNYIHTFLRLVFESFIASVGNLFIKESKDKNKFVFSCLNTLNYIAYGFGSACLFILIQPFILLWAGAEYQLSFWEVLVITVSIMLTGFECTVNSYRSACGLFWKGKIRPIATLIINLVVSIGFTLLFPEYGVVGVILGTIVSNLTTVFWYDPILIFKNAFGCSSVGYFVKFISNCLLTLGISLLGYYLIDVLFLGYAGIGWLTFIASFFMTVIFVALVFFIVYFKTKEFAYVKDIAIRIFRTKILKKKA